MKQVGSWEQSINDEGQPQHIKTLNNFRAVIDYQPSLDWWAWHIEGVNSSYRMIPGVGRRYQDDLEEAQKLADQYLDGIEAYHVEKGFSF